MEVAITDYDSITDNEQFEHWSGQVETLAAKILKEVWIQAKTDGDDIDEKNFK